VLCLESLSADVDIRTIAFEFRQTDDFSGVGIGPALRFPVALGECRVDERHFLTNCLALLIRTRVLFGDFRLEELDAGAVSFFRQQELVSEDAGETIRIVDGRPECSGCAPGHVTSVTLVARGFFP